MEEQDLYVCCFVVYLQLQDMATACIFLAGKVEETCTKLDDTLKVSLHIQHRNAVRKDPNVPPPVLDPSAAEFKDKRKKIEIREHILLHSLSFHVVIEHPYKFMLNHVQNMNVDQKEKKEIAQVAWNFLNDRYISFLV